MWIFGVPLIVAILAGGAVSELKQESENSDVCGTCEYLIVTGKLQKESVRPTPNLRYRPAPYVNCMPEQFNQDVVKLNELKDFLRKFCLFNCGVFHETNFFYDISDEEIDRTHSYSDGLEDSHDNVNTYDVSPQMRMGGPFEAVGNVIHDVATYASELGAVALSPLTKFLMSLLPHQDNGASNSANSNIPTVFPSIQQKLLQFLKPDQFFPQNPSMPSNPSLPTPNVQVPPFWGTLSTPKPLVDIQPPSHISDATFPHQPNTQETSKTEPSVNAKPWPSTVSADNKYQVPQPTLSQANPGTATNLQPPVQSIQKPNGGESPESSEQHPQVQQNQLNNSPDETQEPSVQIPKLPLRHSFLRVVHPGATTQQM